MDFRLTIVSPHCDDAALSAAATLDILCRRGAAVTLVSCFTRSNWAPVLPSGMTVEDVTRIRKREDETWVRRLGALARVIDLRLLDAPLRLPGRSVFDALGKSEEEANVEALAQALRPHIGGGAVFLPLALGGHVDHRVTRAGALRACCGLPLGFYADIPYTFRCDRSQIGVEVAALEAFLGCRLYSVRIPHPCPLTAWRRAVRCYRSQFSRAAVAKMLMVLAYVGGERLWATHCLWMWLRELTTE